MHAGGHSHLILAGDPRITRQIRHALPNDLTEKLVDVIPASKRDRPTEVVMLTLASFIEHEEHESRTVAERLIEGLRRHNLAVAGSEATLDALYWGEVDTLVMVNDYQPDPGWTCTACKSLGTELPNTAICPSCGKKSVRPLDIKEALLRLAEQSERPVEVVERSDALMSLGGVGCLLRTDFDTQADTQTALASATG
jgi:peptide subunit release factor 1 (eRF1)